MLKILMKSFVFKHKSPEAQNSQSGGSGWSWWGEWVAGGMSERDRWR